MHEQNFTMQSRVLAKCRMCGEPLYDGDTAYRLGTLTICPACMEDALTVCRPYENAEPDTVQSSEAEEAEKAKQAKQAKQADCVSSMTHDGKDDRN